jgi:hypothetical protein
VGLVRAAPGAVGWDRVRAAGDAGPRRPDPGVLAASTDQAHLIEAIDAVLRRLGGTARTWRTDRPATVIVPGTGDIQPSFAPVATYYRVRVAPCPPRRGNRKGVVEAAVGYVSGGWWRTLTAATVAQAPSSLDRFLPTTGDARVRRTGDATPTTAARSSPTANHCGRCLRPPIRRPSRLSERSPRTRPSRSAATATRSRPA